MKVSAMKPIHATQLTSAVVLGLAAATACLAPRTANAADASSDASASSAASAAGGSSKDISSAEQALFMENQIGNLKPPLTLPYNYRKSGTLETAFDDQVMLTLTAQPDGSCCTVSARFFTGAREVRQSTVESAQGNPAILYFLERDIREMERLTKGKANYFRKRIRMAVYQGATMRNVTMQYRGTPVPVQQIDIAPYVDDPNRPRFEKLANKKYRFMLSSAVPGGLYGIRTRIDGDTADAPPLMAEELMLDGTEGAPR
jgi:hypothetical protein